MLVPVPMLSARARGLSFSAVCAVMKTNTRATRLISFKLYWILLNQNLKYNNLDNKLHHINGYPGYCNETISEQCNRLTVSTAATAKTQKGLGSMGIPAGRKKTNKSTSTEKSNNPNWSSSTWSVPVSKYRHHRYINYHHYQEDRKIRRPGKNAARFTTIWGRVYYC